MRIAYIFNLLIIAALISCARVDDTVKYNRQYRQIVQQSAAKAAARGVARYARDTLLLQHSSLVDNPHNDCQELRALCAHFKSTENLAILECVNTFSSSQLEAIPDRCQNALWMEQRDMLTVNWIHGNLLLSKQCQAHRERLSSCTNEIDPWNCIRGRFPDLDHGNECRKYVKRIFSTFLPDHEDLGDFFAACGKEVEDYSCGRLNIDHRRVSQLETVQCLKESAGDNLSGACKSSVVHINQQRSDIKFYEVCELDMQRLCSKELEMDMPIAYKCLVKHKSDSSMSRACSEQITKRDQEIARDYRLSRGLAKACKDDIKLHRCRRGVSEDKNVRLAQILLCLEAVAKNGTAIAPECRGEIDDHRQMLMEDYQLSPEILTDCADDIEKFCSLTEHGGSRNVAGGTEVIHCLMQHARVKPRKESRVTAQCLRSLETLFKISDAGEDWRVDPVLHRACNSVVDVHCRDTVGGEARVMSCLMEQIGARDMPPACEQALLLVQYFVARDFKLDPQLYKHCRDDAIKYCNAKHVWDNAIDGQMDPERGPLVLPCLHRIAYTENPPTTLRKDCYKEVKRVMRQRSLSVDLIPEVEVKCIEDLSVFCSERTERGAEMECLQDNLEKLQPDCRKVITQYTEEEAGNIELNPVIMAVCSDAMKTRCGHVSNAGKDQGEMMECLIAHKNDPDLRQDVPAARKCRAAIEHFQIISLKHYVFTYKFKAACRSYVARYCASSTTKNEVVACLSELMRNDTIRGQQHSIKRECRQQVKAQLYQQRETLELDPKLKEVCSTEIESFCTEQRGPGEAIDCLIQNTPRLGSECHHAVFMVKRSELGDSGTDYTLINTCKEMTYKFCPNRDSTKLLDCLKVYKDDPLFDPRCHLVVVNRMIEQNTDYRFNPLLQLACNQDIRRYCSDIVDKAKPNEELNGKVVQCLKNKFRENHLDSNCGQEMIKILQEQALNYKLNPLLQIFCRKEIERFCKHNIERNGDEHGQVEECLKTAFLSERIEKRECKVEVATLIAEAKADIHVDPILENACIGDLLRFCGNVKSGNGRKLSCLQTVLKDQAQSMEEDCRLKLQRRIEMFQNADVVLALPPENMEQLVSQVVASPAKRFFIVILMTAVGMVFIMGIFLGRVSKPALNTKNK